MINMNDVSLIGRFTSDPKITQNPNINNVCICNFILAIPRKTSKYEEPKCDFISCSAYNHNAKFIASHFNKGSTIGISGFIKSSNYIDKSGNENTRLYVCVESIHFTS